jgi:quinol monooxygenase YgiN
MISVIAKVPVKPDAKENAIKEVKALMAEVAKEKGTLHYTLNVNPNEPNTLVFMERYKDMDALSAHGSSPAFLEFMGKAGAFMSGPPEIVTFEEIHSIR